MLFAIIAAWQAYKRAKETNRNPILWAIVAVIVFIGTQMLVGLAIGVLIGIGVSLWGWAENTFEKWELGINIIAVIASLIVTFIMLNLLGRTPQKEVHMPIPPPPPPKFD